MSKQIIICCEDDKVEDIKALILPILAEGEVEQDLGCFSLKVQLVEGTDE